MAGRTEASRWLVGLFAGCWGVGCAGMGLQTPEPPPAGPSTPRTTASPQRAPELRIDSPPALAADKPAVVPAVATAPPATPAPPADADPVAAFGRLHQQASATYAGIDSYIVRLRRREQVNGKDKPEEVLLFKYRKQPVSVYLKWLGKECHGREAVYVKGMFEDKIHTLLAAGDVPFMPAGKRLALAPDNPLVLSSSRHRISDAGVGVILERSGETLAALERGDTRRGSVKYLGPIQRPEFPSPSEALELTIPAGAEPQLARGGRRVLVFDAGNHLPVLVQTYDETGHEVEYYCYEHFQYPVRLDDDDFNPDRLWKKN
jgi:Protein of unknown function (DUF1571)